MSEIARRLTGMSEKELWECDFPTATSNRVYIPEGIYIRDIRLAAGMYITDKDMDKIREELKNTSKSMRIN